MDIQALIQKLAGRFIVFDGVDGCGKTTQLAMLADRLSAAGADVVTCRDPGGTEIGDRIRSVLLHHDLSTMNVNCETLLFMASRAQLIGEIIVPALAAGRTVLCSRFVSATCAYQGAAGYDPRRVVELARFAIDTHWPDVTVLLDVDVQEGFERIGRKPHHAGKHRRRFAGQTTLFAGQETESTTDAMEARPIEFHREVRRMFLELSTYYPAPIALVDGRCDQDAVHERIIESLCRVLA
jgi:dTMP kinase